MDDVEKFEPNSLTKSAEDYRDEVRFWSELHMVKFGDAEMLILGGLFSGFLSHCQAELARHGYKQELKRDWSPLQVSGVKLPAC